MTDADLNAACSLLAQRDGARARAKTAEEQCDRWMARAKAAERELTLLQAALPVYRIKNHAPELGGSGFEVTVVADRPDVNPGEIVCSLLDLRFTQPKVVS